MERAGEEEGEAVVEMQAKRGGRKLEKLEAVTLVRLASMANSQKAQISPQVEEDEDNALQSTTT